MDYIIMECKCTYPGCPRHGKCEECVEFHVGNSEFPACFFSSKAENSYDRGYSKLKEDRG